METLLFGLLASLTGGLLALAAVTALRLSGKVTLELTLGRASGASVTRASEGAQELRPPVTSDVTPQPRLVTRTLNATARVTGYTEKGEAFTVPQHNSTPPTER